jgi:NAD(P)-dependent dehydrogenase (short-subunit alcohol dehydrogenase family)
MKSFYRRWIAACTAGELVGIGTAAAVAVALNALGGEPRSSGTRLLALAVFAAVGAVEGGALAAFQWRVLRTRVPRLGLGEWMAPTIAIAVAGFAGMAPALFLSGPDGPAPPGPGLLSVLLVAAVVGAGAGLCVGAAQWLVLRRHVERAERWIWIHAPAWALAMAAIVLGASIPAAESPAWFIVASGAAGGALGGLVLGAVTGLVARGLRPWVDETRWSLRGRVCAVTGADAGIGFEVALGLARLGAGVALLCRRPAEGERARALILDRVRGADVAVVPCDLGSFESIGRAAGQLLSEWRRLDVLVHSAGATFLPRRTMTDGIEATLAIGVVGPFLLTSLVRCRLEASRGRVVVVTGTSHRKGRIDAGDLRFDRRPYDRREANARAQRGRWLFTWELARRAPRLMTAAVHPGAVLTAARAASPRLHRALLPLLARPGLVRAEVGAIPVLRLAAAPGVAHLSGRFFDRCRAAPDAPDADSAGAFWTACEGLTGQRWPVGAADAWPATAGAA